MALVLHKEANKCPVSVTRRKRVINGRNLVFLSRSSHFFLTADCFLPLIFFLFLSQRSLDSYFLDVIQDTSLWSTHSQRYLKQFFLKGSCCESSTVSLIVCDILRLHSHKKMLEWIEPPIELCWRMKTVRYNLTSCGITSYREACLLQQQIVLCRCIWIVFLDLGGLFQITQKVSKLEIHPDLQTDHTCDDLCLCSSSYLFFSVINLCLVISLASCCVWDKTRHERRTHEPCFRQRRSLWFQSRKEKWFLLHIFRFGLRWPQVFPLDCSPCPTKIILTMKAGCNIFLCSSWCLSSCFRDMNPHTIHMELRSSCSFLPSLFVSVSVSYSSISFLFLPLKVEMRTTDSCPVISWRWTRWVMMLVMLLSVMVDIIIDDAGLLLNHQICSKRTEHFVSCYFLVRSKTITILALTGVSWFHHFFVIFPMIHWFLGRRCLAIKSSWHWFV